MTKLYCDICDQQITDKNGPKNNDQWKGEQGPTVPGRYFVHRNYNGWKQPKTTTGLTSAGIELITHVNGVANSGDICKYCVIDLLKTLDDRPQLTTNQA